MSQDWLIDRMQALGYEADKKGTCFGYAQMAKQAAFVPGGMKVFVNRLGKIKELKTEDLRKIKKEFDKNHLKPLSDPLLRDVFAFFDGIELYHHSHYYKALLGKLVTAQDAVTVTPVVQPIELLPGHRIVSEEKYTGLYSKSELQTYLTLLAQFLNEQSQPFSFVLEGHQHAIDISYDPANKTWCFVDINDSDESPSVKYTPLDNTADLADYIMKAFAQTEHVTFSTHINSLVKEDKITSFREKIAKLNNNSEWQRVHLVTPEKAAMILDGSSWLYTAIIQNDVEKVKELLANNAVVKKDDMGLSLLCMAVNLDRDPEIIRVLLQHPDINISDTYSSEVEAAALHMAAANGNIIIIEELLNHGADVNQELDGKLPIDYAIESGNPAAFHLLLAHDATINPDNTPALFVAACKSGDSEIVQHLSDLLLNDAEITDEKKLLILTLGLYEASKNDHVPIIKYILQYAIDPNAILEDKSALYIATESGQFESAQILLSHGDINPNVGTRYEYGDNFAPLHIASRNNDVLLIQALFSHSETDPNIESTITKSTPLMLAVQNGHLDAAAELLRHQLIDPNKQVDGKSPLRIAINNNDKEMVRLLLSHPKIKLDDYAKLHQKATEQARMTNDHEIVELLENKHKALSQYSHGSTLFTPPIDPIKKASVKFDGWMKNYEHPQQSDNQHLIDWLTADRGAEDIKSYQDFCKLAVDLISKGYATNPPPTESSFDEAKAEYQKEQQYRE